jgi:hypothetical protein
MSGTRRRITKISASCALLAAACDGLLTGEPLGVNFRPVPEAALKLAWVRGETRDRFNNPAANAVVQLGVATYF